MHALDFVRFGPFPYAFGPAWANLFWNTLLLLDLGVCALLATGRRQAGLTLGVVVMIADVAVNVWAWRMLGLGGFAVAVPLQTGFLGFLLGSVGFLLPRGSTK